MLVEMRLRLALLALGLIFVGGGGAGAQRLPGGVRPEHYSLTITPDLAKARFAGSETIEVVLAAPTHVVTLNAAEIEFGAVRAWAGVAPNGAGANAGILRSAQNDKQEQKADAGVLRSAQNDKQKIKATTEILGGAQNDDRGGNDASIGGDAASIGGVGAQTATVTVDAAQEQATFTFARELPAGPVTLEIAYTGILNDKLRGFYLSKTKTRNYGVTQFEATDARRAFPSFDEPALKATFDVSLTVDAGDTALSNTKLVSDTPGPTGKHVLKFAPTPKMSTYLVAWLVGDFQCSEGKADGVPIRVCATPDKLKLTKFALESAKWDLKYYDTYFGIKYPMEKLDLIAIPDFEAGAMENFGCITFRETELLVDEKFGTLPARKDVAETVAHEMAHQWFGDLVTPGWWDNLWLNEGFATWMETKAAGKWQPKWHYEQDVAEDLNRILDEDASRTTRPIRARAETPAEINAMFDDIAYGKAGAVIGMVENWVGEETFRRGVQEYLAEHLYGNATAADFWETQARVSGLPVDKVMQSFVEQPGVPEVTVGNPTHDGKAVMNGAPGAVDVAQTRFFLSDGTPAAQSWTVPVCLRTSGKSGQQCSLLTGDSGKLAVPGTGAISFVYGNANNKGYYRSAYSKKELAAVVANAEKGLTPPEQIGLLGDRWALMRAGQGNVGEFLDLALGLKSDSNATVVDTALSRVSAIDLQIASDEDRPRLERVIRRELGPVYAGLGGGSKHESYDHADLRATLFEALGRAKDPGVLTEAENLTKQLFSGQKPTDPMIGDAAVALATPNGDTEMYDRLQRVSREAADPDLKEAALHVLTRFETPALVERTLKYAISDEVRSQDSWELVALLLARRETQDEAWGFVRQHWAEIEQEATINTGTRLIEAAGSFCTVEKRDEVTSFFQAHAAGAPDRALEKSVDRINACIELRKAQEPALRIWLDKRGEQ